MLHMAIRALSALIVLFVLTRIGGKKQLSQLTFFEYVVGITIGDIAAFVSTDIESNLVHGYTSLVIWGLVPLVIEFISLKSKWVRNLFEGKGRVLIKNGKILEDNLKKEHYSTDELLEQLRLKNAFKVADVEFAVLETNGDLSVLLKKDAMPATVSDLGLVVPPEREPQTVIMDGKIVDESLATAGFNQQWLHTELGKIGVSLDNIFVAQVDTFGQLFVDLYDDQIKVPAPSAKKLTLSTLKKCQADIELFALGSKSQKAKEMYTDAADKLQQTLERVTPFLK